MSSQSWLDYNTQRIKLLLCVDVVPIIYYKHKQSITSTHTNYFDLVFKERGANAPVELDNYTEPIQLVNIPLTFLFFPSLKSKLPSS